MTKGKNPGRIDAKTGRPDAAYPKTDGQMQARRYVDQFSRALGLKRTLTEFGKVKVKI